MGNATIENNQLASFIDKNRNLFLIQLASFIDKKRNLLLFFLYVNKKNNKKLFSCFPIAYAYELFLYCFYWGRFLP